jgi:hypothetical protein
VVDIHFAKERPRVRLQRIVELRSPAALLRIDESRGDKTPNSTIPMLIKGVAIDGVKECARSDPLAARPPIAIAYERRAIPIQPIVETTLLFVPSVRHCLRK